MITHHSPAEGRALAPLGPPALHVLRHRLHIQAGSDKQSSSTVSTGSLQLRPLTVDLLPSSFTSSSIIIVLRITTTRPRTLVSTTGATALGATFEMAPWTLKFKRACLQSHIARRLSGSCGPAVAS